MKIITSASPRNMSSRSSRMPGGRAGPPARIELMKGTRSQNEPLRWSIDAQSAAFSHPDQVMRAPLRQDRLRLADDRARCALAGAAIEPGTDRVVLALRTRPDDHRRKKGRGGHRQKPRQERGASEGHEGDGANGDDADPPARLEGGAQRQGSRIALRCWPAAIETEKNLEHRPALEGQQRWGNHS